MSPLAGWLEFGPKMTVELAGGNVRYEPAADSRQAQ